MSTLALVLGVLLMDARGKNLEGQFLLLWGPIEAFFIGLYAVLLIIALGGPTAESLISLLRPYIVTWCLQALGCLKKLVEFLEDP